MDNGTEYYQHLVHSIARSMYIGRGELEDMEQEGYVGVLIAKEKYKPELGVPFIQYARYWILQQMNQYLDSFIRGPIRLPVHIKNKAKIVNKTIAKLREQDKEVTVETVASITGISENMVNSCFHHIEIRTCELKENYHPVVQPATTGVGEEEWKIKFREAVLSVLSEEEKELVSCKFGLGAERVHTGKELENKFGKSATTKLKKILRKLKRKGINRDRIIENLSSN